MGYNTLYHLSWDVASYEDSSAIEKWLEKEKTDSYKFYAISSKGGGSEPVKWYDHHDDMVELSRAFPQVLFTLEGAGEEMDDRWRKYYLNGKVHIVQAIITYPAFDPLQLK